jgi:hypothetical protein
MSDVALFSTGDKLIPELALHYRRQGFDGLPFHYTLDRDGDLIRRKLCLCEGSPLAPKRHRASIAILVKTLPDEDLTPEQLNVLQHICKQNHSQLLQAVDFDSPSVRRINDTGRVGEVDIPEA